MLRLSTPFALAAALTAQGPTNAHWAFVPVSTTASADIDAVVRARLAREGIAPSPPADRRTLIRRLHLDLIGLPPTPAEVDAFVADARPDAYGRLVDRLLASPHFGERWARHWLDLARYADSDGYEKDTVRPHAWRYRDRVIAAINDDLPFDRFVVEQLAGDLLPDATDDQLTASGFHRHTLTNKEGGVDQEEYRVKAVVDRVNTTGTALLGLTIGCAQCHDHKYDPFSQRDYFGLFAFFNDADERDVAVAPSPPERARYERELASWRTEEAELRAKVRADRPRLERALEAFESARQDEGAWHPLELESARSTDGVTLTPLDDGSILASGPNPARADYTIRARTELDGITGFQLEVLTDRTLVEGGPGRTRHGNFVLSELEVSAADAADPARPKPVALSDARATHEQRGYPIARAIDGALDTGWAIQPQYHRAHRATFRTVEPMGDRDGTAWTFRIRQRYGSQHTIGRFRILARTGPMPELTLAHEIEAIFGEPPAERSAADRAKLLDAFARIDPESRPLVEALDAHRRDEPKPPAARAMAFVQRGEPRVTRIHERGDFLRPGDVVEPNTPAVLPALEPRGERPDRLDLARWIADANNPLTARVAVNRAFQHLLGFGLVRTSGDFGTRGELPSHPELLDGLARWFVESGWSRKALIRRIVLSRTYRQSSRRRPELEQIDPENRLLARQNRFRVEAEIVRDLCLAASGLLEPRIGGPSVRPPLPAGIADLGYARSVRWTESEGADRYRRGLYIHFQRTVPYPMLVTFDCPESTVTSVRRDRSNSPLQALTTLNDPVFVECARALARLAAGPGLRPAEVIETMFARALGRRPEPGEATALVAMYERQRAGYATDADAARKLAGELLPGVPAADRAALVAVARIVLNLDEFLTRS